jgi:hypothetical protein
MIASDCEARDRSAAPRTSEGARQINGRADASRTQFDLGAQFRDRKICCAAEYPARSAKVFLAAPNLHCGACMSGSTLQEKNFLNNFILGSL